MNEKTTVYLEPKLKEQIKIKLIQNGENQSLSNLVNELLKEWYAKQKKNSD